MLYGVSIAVSILIIVAECMVYEKADQAWWKVFIPFYNCWVLFDIVYGKGSKMFLLLIPFYNIYVLIKFYIDMAHAYDQSTGFGVLLLFFPYVMYPVIGFSKEIEYVGPVEE